MSYRDISIGKEETLYSELKSISRKSSTESIIPGELHKSRSPGLEFDVSSKSFKLDPTGMVRMIQTASLTNQLIVQMITGIKIDWGRSDRDKLQSIIDKSGVEIAEVLETNGWFGRSKLRTPDSEYFYNGMVLLSNFLSRLKEDRIKSSMLKLLSVVEGSCKTMDVYGNDLKTLKSEFAYARNNITNNLQSLSMVVSIAITQCYVARQLGKTSVYNLIVKTISSCFKELNINQLKCHSLIYEYSVQPAEDFFENEGKKILTKSGSDKDISSVLEVMFNQGVIVPLINNTGNIVAKPEIYEGFDLNVLINKNNINYSEIGAIDINVNMTEVSDTSLLMLNVAISLAMFESVFFQLNVK